MKRLFLLVVCGLLVATLSAAYGQPSVAAGKVTIPTEVEGLEGAKVSIDSTTLTIAHSFAQNKTTYSLLVSGMLVLPRENALRQHTWGTATVTKVIADNGKDLTPPQPQAHAAGGLLVAPRNAHIEAAPLVVQQLAGGAAGAGGQVAVEQRWPLNLTIPLEAPLPNRLELMEARWSLRTVTHDAAAYCDFKQGQVLKLHGMEATVRTAEITGNKGQLEIIYDAPFDASSGSPMLDFQVLDMGGKVLTVSQSTSRFTTANGRSNGSITHVFDIPEGRRPTRIQGMLLTRLMETSFTIRIKGLPVLLP